MIYQPAANRSNAQLFDLQVFALGQDQVNDLIEKPGAESIQDFLTRVALQIGRPAAGHRLCFTVSVIPLGVGEINIRVESNGSFALLGPCPAAWESEFGELPRLAAET